MTRQELIDYCLTLPAAYEDYPFDDITDDKRWTVMRHQANKKTFAMIYERNDRLCINLKCEPIEADFRGFNSQLAHEQDALEHRNSRRRCA